ncbi:MAG: arginase family protein [Deltaproteobacteria bacterium]|nr:arginase family protein [Deltaproteobacteria bacterium]
MRLVPILFPCDLGHSDHGRYVLGGERGAPDVLLDVLESEGVRFARPIAVPVESPEAPDPEDSFLKFDEALARATKALAAAVEQVNADADFPVILGGDHTGLLGHVLGHSARHKAGVGLAVLADARLDLARPAEPVYGDTKRLAKDAQVTETGDAHRMVLAGALRLLPAADSALGAAVQTSAVRASQTSVVGVRGGETAQVRASERKAGLEVWRMERLELDGESEYRSMLTRHLSEGPIVLSLDVSGLDPDLMTAVRDPLPDGLDWTFLKRTLEQCIPHVDRLLGLDICQLDPTRDDAHKGAMVRFAETMAPFLKRIVR